MERFLFLIVLSGSLFRCDSDNPFTGVNCTDQLVYGLSVTLRDATTNAVITDNITVTATDGDYQETLMTIASIDNFFGAGERPGTYIISTESVNYESFISDPITVSLQDDGCHVITQDVEFVLLPN